MKKWKSNKGSITLFVLIALLFFIGILLSSYLSSIISRKTQDDATKRVKEIYEKDVGRMEDIYQEIAEENRPEIPDVPIPDGFYYVGGEIDTGVVISDDPDDEYKGDSHEVAQNLEGNQFVWIPVPNPDEMFTTDSSGKHSGKLYTFSAGKEPEVITGEINKYREPDTIGIADTVRGVTKTSLQNEIDAMAESVIKYKGFYLGRYEAGMDVNKLTSKTKNAWPSNKNWYDLYNAAKKTYPNDSTNTKGAVSQMVWGCQWDAACRWFNTFPELKDDNYVTDSQTPGKGNYAPPGSLSIGTPILTGSDERYKVKNIYDMAGNYEEQTMEMSGDEYRVRRGGRATEIPVPKGFVASRTTVLNTFWKPNDLADGQKIFTTRLALYVKP